MSRWILFVGLSLLIVIVSRKSLLRFRSHGFYRFLGWECIAWLLVSNYPYWFVQPFSIRQVASWILLLISAYMVIAGVVFLKKYGKPKRNRKENSLYAFEKTTELVDKGVFRYIRHPLYSSLLFLAWGIFLKHISLGLLMVAFGATVFLYLTAIVEEKECIVYFGDAYKEYMTRSKRFIPFLI